jgi:hypothetical protein
VKASSTAGRFDVTDDGQGLENRAGMALPAQVANHVGLTGGLRRALSRVRGGVRAHVWGLPGGRRRCWPRPASRCVSIWMPRW